MPKTHAIMISTSMESWNIDAQRICGIYKDADVDNGVLVTLDTMNVDAENNVQGYEYNVKLAQANSSACWIVDTPLPSASIESQIFEDPRYFVNEAGRPLSLRYLNAHVDHIEVDASAFTAGNAPSDQKTYKYAAPSTGGKLAMANEAPAQGTYFALVGIKSVGIGQESVPTYVLRCERN